MYRCTSIPDIYIYIYRYSTHKIPTFSIQSPSSQGTDQRIEFGLSQWVVRRLQQQMGRDRGPNLRGLTGKFPEVKRDKYLVLNVAVCLLVFLFSVFFQLFYIHGKTTKSESRFGESTGCQRRVFWQNLDYLEDHPS